MDANAIQHILSNAGAVSSKLTPLAELAAALPIDGRIAPYFPTPAVETPTPIFTLGVPAPSVIREWERLRALTPLTRHYPVIIGGARGVNAHYNALTRYTNGKKPADFLRESQTIDARKWLDEKWEAFFDLDDDFSEADLRGEWTNPIYDLTTDIRETLATDILGYKPDPIQYIALVGTPHSWEVPAYLGFGSWNACPSPAVHVALHRAWAARWRTEIVAITSDTLVCRANVPLIDREMALSLAKEHLVYCEDIVMQGTGTIDALAAEIVKFQSWFFWWD